VHEGAAAHEDENHSGAEHEGHGQAAEEEGHEAQGETENPDSLSHNVNEAQARQVSDHLPALVQRMQQNFGEDFSNVTFSDAVPGAAKEHGAKAVAGPEHVALDSSVDPGTPEGQRIVGEELGHVTQMRRNTVQPDAVDTHGGAGFASAGTGAGASRERAESEAASAGEAAARGERVNIGGGGAVPQNLFFGLGSLWDKAKAGVAKVGSVAQSAGNWALDKGKQGVSFVAKQASEVVNKGAKPGEGILGAAGRIYNNFNEKKNAAWDKMNSIANPLLKFGVTKAAGFVASKIPGISPLLADPQKGKTDGEKGRSKFLGALNPLKWYGKIKSGAEEALKLKKGGLLDRMGLRDVGARFKKIERFVEGKKAALKDWGLGKAKGAWASLKQTAGNAWSSLKSAPGKALDKIKGLFPAKAGGKPGFFGKIFGSAKEKIGGFFGKAKGLAGDLFASAKNMGSKGLDFMKGLPGKAWDIAKTLPGKAFEKVKGLGGMIKGLLPKGSGKPGLFGKALAGLKKLGGPIMSGLGKLGSKAMPFISGLGKTIGKVGKSAMPVLQGLGKALKSVGPGALKVLGPVGKFLGKAGAKIIPGLNIAASLISTGLSGKAAFDNFRKGNITGGLIDSFNTITNAAGMIPVVGGVISVAGDLISGGLHWLTGK